MKRRQFTTGFGCLAATGLLAAGLAPAHAQAPNRIYRLAHLGNSQEGEAITRAITLPDLARLGFVEGRNLTFEGRIGPPSAMPDIARELLTNRPDVLVAIGPSAISAASAATRAVPIVGFGSDPVELGLAQSHARPGGNVTGIAILASELEGKRLSILHEAVPGQQRVAALLSTTGNPVSEPALRKAATNLRIELVPFSVSGPTEYPAAFAAIRAAGVSSLVIGATSEFHRDAKQLATFALEARLPTVCEWAEMAQAGCLIGYGPNRVEMRKRMAIQISTIFLGETPGNMPIEQPTRFEFAINSKVAKALGVTIPASVLLRADDVIE